jgi:hypothetical protein
MEVVMLEKYFLRLETLDRIRGSWIGPAVEKYVEWLDENRYARHVVASRVPTLMHFGAFAERRGAKTWDELPSHVGSELHREEVQDEGMEAAAPR